MHGSYIKIRVCQFRLTSSFPQCVVLVVRWHCGTVAQPLNHQIAELAVSLCRCLEMFEQRSLCRNRINFMAVVSQLTSINGTQFRARRYTQPQKNISALHVFCIYFVIIGLDCDAQQMCCDVHLCTLLRRRGGAP